MAPWNGPNKKAKLAETGHTAEQSHHVLLTWHLEFSAASTISQPPFPQLAAVSAFALKVLLRLERRPGTLSITTSIRLQCQEFKTFARGVLVCTLL